MDAVNPLNILNTLNFKHGGALNGHCEFRIHSGFTVAKFRVFRVFRIDSGFTVSKFRVFRVFRIHNGFTVSKFRVFRVFRIHSGFTVSIQSTTMFKIQSVQNV